MVGRFIVCWSARRGRLDGTIHRESLNGANWAFIMRLISLLRSATRSRLRLELEQAGAEIVELPASEDLSLDAVYTHDASLTTDFGLISMRPGKKRTESSKVHITRVLRADRGIPTFGEISRSGIDRSWRHPLAGSKDVADRPWLSHQRCRNRQMRKVVAPPKGVEVLLGPASLRRGSIAMPASDVADQFAG